MQQAQVIPLQRADRHRSAATQNPPSEPRRSAVERAEPVEPTPLHPLREQAPDPSREQRLADTIAFLRKRITGDYPVDEFGFDRELTDTLLLPPLRLLYRKW